jgi:hypothetical protein
MGIVGHPPKRTESMCDRCPWHYQDWCPHPKGKEGDCPSVGQKVQRKPPSP